jgi:Tfp pilus assembly protein PilN
VSGRKSNTLVLGGRPQVDLLPVAEREAIRRRPVVRRLISGVITVALLVIAAVVAANIFVVSVNEQVEAEQFRSQELLAQQLEFTEVAQMRGALAEAEAARGVATATEIDWQALLAEIRAALPDGVSLESVNARVTTPGSLGSTQADLLNPDGTTGPQPLREDSVASIRIIALSPTVPEVEVWLDRLESVTGFAGIAPPVSVVSREGTIYGVTIEVLLNETAYLGRFQNAAPAEEGN